MSLRGWLRRRYCAYLTRRLSATPDHVAVIQDGNRRYADAQGLARERGHARGAATTEALLDWCLDLDIGTVTLYTFSIQNFNRPADEQASLFDLITEKLYEFADADRIHENAVCIRGLGDIEQLPPRLQDAVDYAERRTRAYDRLQLNIALAYGGRHELLRAAQRVTAAVAAGERAVTAITTDTVADALYRDSLPDVDLLIRTGGERRTSNFLPWHAVGSEAAVYFTDAYWPSFSRREFLAALHTYAQRDESAQRRRRDRLAAIADVLSTESAADGTADSSSGSEDVTTPYDDETTGDGCDQDATASSTHDIDQGVLSAGESQSGAAGDSVAVGDADD